MMKNKSVINFICAFCCLLLTQKAFSASFDVRLDGIYYKFTDKGAVVSSGDEKYIGDVIIPEQIEWINGSVSVIGIGKRAFAGSSALKSVTISKNITSISDGAFYGCTDLKSIEIPANITEIGENAFYASGLTSILIPSSVLKIGNNACGVCKSLTSAHIQNNYVSENQFYNCLTLQEVEMTDKVSIINKKAFAGCVSIEKISMAAISHIGESAFSGCKSLFEISFPNTLESIGDKAFANCELLTSVTIPSSVTNIGEGVFSKCSALINVNLSDNIKNLSARTFAGCVGLKTIALPVSIETLSDGCFSGCKSLTDIEIPQSVKSLGNALFSGCINLNTITIAPNSIPSISKTTFNGVPESCVFKVPNNLVTNYGQSEAMKKFTMNIQGY